MVAHLLEEAILEVTNLVDLPSDNAVDTAGRWALVTATGKAYRDNGTVWVEEHVAPKPGTVGVADLSFDPFTQAEADAKFHATTGHAHTGATGDGPNLSTGVITGLAEFIRDTAGAALVAGTRITITVNDPGDTITIASDDSSTAEFVRDTIGTALVAGTGMSITVNDAGDTITLASTGGYTDEQVDDRVAALLVAGTNITLTYNDVANTLTIAAAGGGSGGHIIEKDDGTDMTARGHLMFKVGSSGATVTDDSGNDRTILDISSLSGPLAFPNSEIVLSPPKISDGWAWVNQGDATYTETAMGITMVAPPNAGNQIRMLAKTLPAAPYKITMKVRGVILANNYESFGIGLRDSTSGKIMNLAVSATSLLVAQKHSGPSNNFIANYFAITQEVPPEFFQIEDDNTNRIYRVSNDGIGFRQVHTVVHTDYATPDQIALVVGPSLSGWNNEATLLHYSTATTPTIAPAVANAVSTASRVTVWADEATQVVGTWSRTIVAGQPYNFYSFQASPAIGDILEWKVDLSAGTYTLGVLGTTDSNRGIVKWTLDGADILTGQDWYGSSANNTVKTGTVTVPTSGQHTLRMQVTGKNGSSSGYSVTLTKAWLTQ